MKISDACAWLLQRGVRNGPYGLDRINFILEELENPHHEFACVLIGGTNGKGSVTAITESIMAGCPDYITGSLTSPHLVNIKGRIKLAGRPLPDKYWIEGVERLLEVCKVMDKEASIGHASFFEAVAALAFWAFREAELDLAIVEVGLGGRFDATNATNPEVSVITNIGTDHQEFLGTGKISIAREKLGIVRKNRPLITGEKSPEVLAEFERVCKEKNSPLILCRQQGSFELIESRADGHFIKLSNESEPVFFPLPGEHQLENLAISLEVINQLRKNGFEIPDAAIAEGIEKVRWPGRLQWIPGTPPVLLDGAHNAEGIAMLANYLEKFPPAGPLNIIFGALKDKPLLEMAGKLAKFGHRLCFVSPSCNRALTREDFADSLETQGWQWFSTLAEAHKFCQNDAGTILITGSLYLISDALRMFGQNV
ncbi:MAG: bifunctional folylpolyglutamate synthase/dihydrofolate synthase [Candidatus Riflebacteria bacterium]|nr:bifunctional folylpolyglutamate synthase/dihydrofolate synthase [Candidatus Riflebacteria bacterium]